MDGNRASFPTDIMPPTDTMVYGAENSGERGQRQITGDGCLVSNQDRGKARCFISLRY